MAGTATGVAHRFTGPHPAIMHLSLPPKLTVMEIGLSPATTLGWGRVLLNALFQREGDPSTGHLLCSNN